MITLALLAWPIITMVLVRRLSWPVAASISVIGGYLLLAPQRGIDLPLLPPLNDNTLPIFTVMALALLMRPGDPKGPLPDAMPASMIRPGWLPTTALGLGLLALWIIGGFMTALTNGDRIFIGNRILPPLTLYDGFSIVMNSSPAFAAILIGRRYFWHPEMHRVLLAVLAVAALIYSLPALYESLTSPRLNIMVYGFFAHSWEQHIRSSGYRPLVFLNHGLLLAIFMAMGLLAMAAMVRLAQTRRARFAALVGMVWLLGALVMCRSLGAFMIAMGLLGVVLFLSARLQLLIAAAIAATVLLYPMLRSIDVIPTQWLVETAYDINPTRAQSLGYRFGHEDALLARAAERPIFGWGGWARNRVFDAFGNDISTTDGSWVLAFGMGGWVRYIAIFGLLTLPTLILAFRRRNAGVDLATAMLATVLVARAFDLLPNSGLVPMIWLIAGAVLGRIEVGEIKDTSQTPAAQTAPSPRFSRASPGLVYTRQAHHHVRKPVSRES